MRKRFLRPSAPSTLAAPCALAAAMLAVLAPGKAAAITVFPIRFDDRGLEQQSFQPRPPLTGEGVFSFDDSLPDGAYPFKNLSNPTFSAFIGGETFTLLDNVKYDPSLLVVIHDSGSRFYFDGPPAPNSSIGGSLEITNKAFSSLAFEPKYFTPPPYNLYLSIGPGFFYQGTYGTIVPSPLPVLGVGMLLAHSRRLRRRLHQDNSSRQR